MSKYPSKKKQGDDGLADVPAGTRMVPFKYRGELRRIPWYLHPSQADFDDFDDDGESLQVFLFTGKLPRRRVELEQRYGQ